MTTDEYTARAMVDACHAAWSRGDLNGLLSWYRDDAVYRCNIGPNNDGQAFVARGKGAIREFLAPVLLIAESMSVCDHFVFADDEARVQVSCFIREKRTGHTLSGTYRQKYKFESGLIACVEEIHDAAKMAAFWRMVDVDAISKLESESPLR